MSSVAPQVFGICVEHDSESSTAVFVPSFALQEAPSTPSRSSRNHAGKECLRSLDTLVRDCTAGARSGRELLVAEVFRTAQQTSRYEIELTWIQPISIS